MIQEANKKGKKDGRGGMINDFERKKKVTGGK